MSNEENPLDAMARDVDTDSMLDELYHQILYEPAIGKDEIEFVLNPETIIWSETDTKSFISDCGKDFVYASGYPKSELIGEPHNILRHPDMPRGAFKDMWDTINSGMPWQGVVQNKRKDGKYYWVDAIAQPIHHNGIHKGFLSVRLPATAEQIAKASKLYAKLNKWEREHPVKGKPGIYKIKKPAPQPPSRIELIKWLGVTAVTFAATIATAFTGHLDMLVAIGLGGVASFALFQINKLKLLDDQSDTTKVLAELATGSFNLEIDMAKPWAKELMMIKAKNARAAAMLAEAEYDRAFLRTYRVTIRGLAIETDTRFIIQDHSVSAERFKGQNTDLGSMIGNDFSRFLTPGQKGGLLRHEHTKDMVIIDDKIYECLGRCIVAEGRVAAYLFVLYESDL